jgi:outer membrane protein assembly factor BamB
MTLTCLLPFLLSACQFNPIGSGTPALPQSKTIAPAASTMAQANTQKSSLLGFSKQAVTFHDRATRQPLNFFYQLPKGKQPISLRFVGKNQGHGKNKITMPENTAFKVRFKAGPRFEILDNNALDGEAVVQMPSELREGYTRVRSPRSGTLLRSLTLLDPLYKLTQQLLRNDEGPGSFLLQAKEDKERAPKAKPTNRPKPLKPLKLTSVCSADPDDYRLWKIENPNDEAVPFEWEIAGSSQSGEDLASAGDSYFETETESGDNKLLLSVEGKKDLAKASLPTQCHEGEEPGVSIWWKLGVRPFPIPASWNEGSDYVLEFKPQNIPAFSLRWAKTNASAPDFPPGLAEIGPAGGSVNLPGVAQLQVPAGAVNQKTLFKIAQVSQAMGLQSQCESRILAEESCLPGYDFASALVRLEPFKLTLNTPATLSLNIDAARLGNNHPGSLRYKANQTSGIDPESWVFDPLLAPISGSVLNATVNTPIPVKTLAHVAAFMPVLVGPQDGFMPVKNGALLLSQKESSVSPADASAMLTKLSAALGYYASLGLPAPLGWQREWANDSVLPVTIMKGGNQAGVSEVFSRSLVTGPPETEQIQPNSKFLGSKIVLRQCSATGENCNGYAATERLATDAFHLVQQGYYRDATGQNATLNYAQYLQNLGLNNETNSEDRGLLKSTASVMGAYFSTRQQSLASSEDSSYLGHLQASQARITQPIHVSTQQESFEATGLLSHLLLSDPAGLGKLAEFTRQLGALWTTGVEAESKWSPSLKALHQSVDMPALYQSYAQAAATKTNLNLLTGLAVNPPVHSALVLNSEHQESSPLSIPVDLSALSAQFFEISADPALGEVNLFVRLKANGQNGPLLEPVEIQGALPGTNLASSDFFKAHARVLKRSANAADTEIGAFGLLSSQASSFENFGNPGQSNVLHLAFSNSLNQRKDASVAKIKGILEVFYSPNNDTEPEDPLRGTVQWQAPLPVNFTVGEASPLLHNGLLYLVGPSGQILAQKADSGQTEWQRSLPTAFSASPALGSDGSLYLGGANGTFYALNPDGIIRWSFTPDEPNSFRLGGVALDENGILYTGGTAEAVYALNSQTGQEVWRFQARAPIDSAPIVSKDRVYILALDQTLYALDRATGAYLWEFQTGQPISDITPALTGNGDIVFGSSDTWLYSVDKLGYEKWSYIMQGALSASPVIGPEGNVYAPCADGRLYAFDVLGNLLWHYETGAHIQAAPVVGENGKVYIGTSQGKVVALYPDDGRKDWERSFNGAVQGRLILDHLGTLYGITSQGQSFSIVTGKGPALLGWPMEHGNLQGWGRVE